MALPISYKLEPTVNINPESKSDSIKVDIVTHTSETGINTVLVYAPLFKTGSPESWIKFQTMLQKIINGEFLRLGHKCMP